MKDKKKILEHWRKQLSGLEPIKSLGPDSTYPRPEKNSMNESKHTPGPWVPVRIGKSLYISPQNGGFVADMQRDDCANDIARTRCDSDARFICLACNAHDDLLEALVRIRDDDKLDVISMEDIARAAIAKSEKK